MTPVLAWTTTAWWATLGAGLVVALVVWALLERLRRTLVRVDEEVKQLWTAGQRVAQNTQTVYHLRTTGARGRELAAELERHRRSEGATER